MFMLNSSYRTQLDILTQLHENNKRKLYAEGLEALYSFNICKHILNMIICVEKCLEVNGKNSVHMSKEFFMYKN